MPSVIVIGARRARQGIGEFVARWLHAAGADVRAVVGTEPDTTSEAQQALRERYGIQARGYVSLDVALEEESPDIVAICSPIPFHREELRRAAEAGLDCLCEKPMWWGDSGDRRAETEEIVDAFLAKDRVLGLITQWPFTLPAFYQLHPDARGRIPRTFDMHLSPIQRGPRMLIDSLSHPISLLQALAGAGTIEEPHAEFLQADRSDLRLRFRYRHAAGTIESTCRLRTCAEAPRPAGYALDGRTAEREVEMPHYAIRFRDGDRTVAVEDPLKRLVEDFLRRVALRERPDRRLLVDSMDHLETLHAAGAAAPAP